MENTGPVSLFYFIRKKEAFNRDQFIDYRVNFHGAKIMEMECFQKHLLRYEQYSDIPDERVATEAVFNLPPSGFDGVSVLTFATIADAKACFTEPDFLNFAKEDRPNFCKVPDTTLAVTLTGKPTIIFDREQMNGTK